MTSRIVFAVAFLAIVLAADAGGKRFNEKGGIVAMEAENATRVRGWKPVDIANASGKTMVDDSSKGRGSLTFEITFEKSGVYFVWFRHMKPANATDDKNDCFVRFDRKPLMVWEGSGKAPDGCGTHHKKLTWESRPKAHTASDRKKHVCIEVKKRGRHKLEIISRSRGYLVDKVCLIHADNGGNDKKPKQLVGMGPKETVK